MKRVSIYQALLLLYETINNSCGRDVIILHEEIQIIISILDDNKELKEVFLKKIVTISFKEKTAMEKTKPDLDRIRDIVLKLDQKSVFLSEIQSTLIRMSARLNYVRYGGRKFIANKTKNEEV